MTVQAFDSWEEMQEALGSAVEQAKLRASPEQNAITYGDHWMKLVLEDDPPMLIAGRIHSLEELESGAGSDWESEKPMFEGSYANGFRFGMAYSLVVPDGELGDSHVCEMEKITEDQFELMREANWSGENLRWEPWFREIARRYLMEQLEQRERLGLR